MADFRPSRLQGLLQQSPFLGKGASPRQPDDESQRLFPGHVPPDLSVVPPDLSVVPPDLSVVPNSSSIPQRAYDAAQMQNETDRLWNEIARSPEYREASRISMEAWKPLFNTERFRKANQMSRDFLERYGEQF
jgi:hypothetical protein